MDPTHADQPDTSRARLISAAARLFQERGYSATGLADILKRAGAPKGSLYHHFPGGKAQLTAAAMRGAGGLLRKALTDAHADCGTASGAIARFADQLAGWLEASQFRRGCPMATVTLECAPGDDDLALSVRDGFAQTVSLLANMIETEGASPERAVQLAEFSFSALEGALILARAAGEAGPVRRAGHEAAALINQATA